MHKKLSFTLLCLVLSVIGLHAQTPLPAPPQSKGILLQGGNIHTGTGTVLENAAIAFNEGKITYVGSVDAIDIDTEQYRKIDVAGKEVYPGLILPNTQLGLVEIGAVNATVDFAETGGFNPEVRSIIAYNTDSELIPTVRSNGVLVVQPTPAGGLVSGTSSVVVMDAWNWEDAVIKIDDGIHLNWPSMFLPARWWMGEDRGQKNQDYDNQVRAIEQVFQEAKGYADIDKPTRTNLKLEAMRGLFDGSKTLFLHEDFSRSIVGAIQLLESYGVKRIVLVGGEDAYYVRDFLKDRAIPILLANIHRLPAREGEDVDLPYKMPKLLHEAGILVGLYYGGGMGAQNSRNLPFFAGTATAYGLDKEEALKMVTANTAKILGLSDRLGTLEVGKDATLVVSSGDLLDMRTNHVEHAFIQGRDIDLDNKHKALYRKFQEKYSRQK